ncbi:MAG: hypothetical protein AAGA69_03090, partial [Pseudomonadota bacterium]
GDGNDSLDGGFGADTLFGGNGDDTLIAGSTSADDVVRTVEMSGGAGDDLFVMSTFIDSAVITGFSAGAGTDDVIDLRETQTVFEELADVIAASTEVGGNVEVNTGAYVLTIEGITLAQLDADDFIFSVV